MGEKNKSMFKEIYSNEQLLAQVYDMNRASGIHFPTPDDVSFQFGFGVVDDRKELVPHIHKRAQRNIETTSEFLYVISGKMQIYIYDDNERFIEKVVLKSNCGLLQFFGGHKITIEKNTKYFEIKQGPYKGRDFDKYTLELI